MAELILTLTVVKLLLWLCNFDSFRYYDTIFYNCIGKSIEGDDVRILVEQNRKKQVLEQKEVSHF